MLQYYVFMQYILPNTAFILVYLVCTLKCIDTFQNTYIEDAMVDWSIYKKCRTLNLQSIHCDLSNEKPVFTGKESIDF